MNPWLVVPTLGNREEALAPLIRDADIPAVEVRTERTRRAPHAHDDREVIPSSYGAMNIQRWWNEGIEFAVRRGADVVVLCNDDVAAAPGALLQLAAHIEAGEASSPMLVWPQDDAHAAGRVTSISGYCFALDPARIRPDEAFSWWYGDNDLELRARAMMMATGVGGALGVRGLDITHLRTDFAYDRPVQHLIDADRALFTRRYPDLMGGWK